MASITLSVKVARSGDFAEYVVPADRRKVSSLRTIYGKEKGFVPESLKFYEVSPQEARAISGSADPADIEADILAQASLNAFDELEDGTILLAQGQAVKGEGDEGWVSACVRAESSPRRQSLAATGRAVSPLSLMP